jgi:HK97 family phage major capsid protein
VTAQAPEVEDLTIPETSAQLEEFMLDRNKMANLFKQKDGFATFVRNYAKAVHNKDQEIATQVREETQRVLGQWLRDQASSDDPVVPINLGFTNPREVVDRASARNGLHNPRAMGAALDKEFGNSADYFKLIWHQANRDAAAQAKLHRVRNAFSSTVPSEGGFLIPETLRSELLRVGLETAIVRPRARVIPMETLRVPFPAVDSTSNVSSVYGGIVGYWTEEGAALTASQASFGRVVLDAKKLTAYTEVPNELLSDSISSFQAFIDQIFPEALSFYEDYAFLRGTGVGEPLGVLNSSARITVTETTANLILWSDVVAMYARMLPGSLNRAVWVASIDTFPQLAQMTLPVKNVAGTENVGGAGAWTTDMHGNPQLSLLGRPVILTEKVPGLGTTGALNFVDFGFYLLGDRQVMSAQSSEHYKFGNDMTAYRIIERVDGRPWLNSAITPKNNTNTLSPIVSLLSA